jgi:hypothetical protein
VRAFGILRTQAMEFRDARGDGITQEDWAAIEQQLDAAYQHLGRYRDARKSDKSATWAFVQPAGRMVR